MHLDKLKATGQGELDELIPATWQQHEFYTLAVEDTRPSGFYYYYPALLAYQRRDRRTILLHEDAGSLCVYRLQTDGESQRLELYLAPKPMNADVLKRCFQRVNDFNGDRKARIMRIDETDALAITAAGYRVRERYQQFIFSPDNYQQLAGKSLYTVRRQVTRTEKLGEVQVKSYSSEEHKEDCRDLLRRWGKEHREKHGTTGGVAYTRNILDLADKLPERMISGQVVLINGKLCAFSFGGSIHSGLACSYERKCDTSVAGLTYYQLRKLLLHLGDHKLVNDGSDANRPGLRQLKQSFRPVSMHQEYRGYQK